MYGHVPRKLTMIGTGIALVYEILMVVELFRHYLFIVDDAGYYVKSPVIWVVSGSGTFLLFCFLIFILIWARNMLETSLLISLLSFAALPTIAGIVQLITKNTALVYVGVTLSLLVVYSTIHKDTVNKLESAKNELEEARLNLMFSQIRPHFMYNSLTAIAQLCTIDPKRAQRATIDFSNYLRGNLDSVNYTQPIPFSQELKHLKTYLSLELMRFDDKLSVEYDIETEDFLVPVLSVQPLVENAVKHGICKKRDGGTVKISTRETEDSYIVEVADDGAGFDPNAPLDDSKSHIGVSSVRRRIESMMGGTLEIVSEVGVGTHSVLTIPKGKEQE
jgi:LytS/YehU family sensor histidine kinase